MFHLHSQFVLALSLQKNQYLIHRNSPSNRLKKNVKFMWYTDSVAKLVLARCHHYFNSISLHSMFDGEQTKVHKELSPTPLISYPDLRQGLNKNSRRQFKICIDYTHSYKFKFRSVQSINYYKMPIFFNYYFNL